MAEPVGETPTGAVETTALPFLTLGLTGAIRRDNRDIHNHNGSPGPSSPALRHTNKAVVQTRLRALNNNKAQQLEPGKPAQDNMRARNNAE